tara:strand:- start:1002 stop:1367 length:366 start_codon:yes stop_codon:yes gene_type:complete
MTKKIFHFLNIIFVFLYVYPGSILGFLIYKDISKQPQITTDFIVSSNHVYAFLFLSLLGLISYINKYKIIIIYFLLTSVILELLHIFIPNRSFQFSDLFGNILGVLISIALLILFNFWRKK